MTNYDTNRYQAEYCMRNFSFAKSIAAIMIYYLMKRDVSVKVLKTIKVITFVSICQPVTHTGIYKCYVIYHNTYYIIIHTSISKI